MPDRRTGRTQSTPRTLAISHRAHSGTHPENTLAGIHAAIEDGIDAIEVDVRRTLDGRLILMHDATFERTAGDRRVVAETPHEALAALRVRSRDPGAEAQPIPTLEEVLAAIDGRAALVLDFVDEALADDCVAAVRQAGAASWTWWTAHTPRLAERLLRETPGSRSLLGWTPGDLIIHSPIDAIDLAVRRGLGGLNADHRYVDRTVVDYAHREDLAVYVWTVNDHRRMRALIEMGVDGITTDYPGTLATVRDHVQAVAPLAASRTARLR